MNGIQTATAILYEALASPIGVVVEFSSTYNQAQNLLHAAKRSSPDFVQLEIRPSPENKQQAWIVKKGAEIAHHE